MKQENKVPGNWYVNPEEKSKVRKASKKQKMSEGQIIRNLINASLVLVLLLGGFQTTYASDPVYKCVNDYTHMIPVGGGINPIATPVCTIVSTPTPATVVPAPQIIYKTVYVNVPCKVTTVKASVPVTVQDSVQVDSIPVQTPRPSPFQRFINFIKSI